MESLLLQACRRQPTSRTPIWLMRQAGRYMQEYRDLRARHSFLTLCQDADLATEVTVFAAKRLGVDAAIIFSDILLLLQPMGLDLSYSKDEGPVIGTPIRSVADVENVRTLPSGDPFPYITRAIQQTRAALPEIPLIGFGGAPFTLASYMIEGGSAKHFIRTKSFMYSQPEAWHRLLEKIVASQTIALGAQVDAGANVLQLFDSWVGCLSPEDYRRFVLPHSRKLIAALSPRVPVIHFGTQASGLLSLIKEAGGDVIGVDWRMDLDRAWNLLGDVAVQGNLDPVTLFGTEADLRRHTERILAQAAGRPGHIFNLGHGILPQTPVDNVLRLIELVRTLSERPKATHAA